MADDALELTGLDKAKANLRKLNEDMRNTIIREGLKGAALYVVRAVKNATYTTFIRRSGYIKKGFGITVYKQVKNEQLEARIVQYPQSALGGGAEPALFRASAFRKGKWAKNPDKRAIAFYWRFLEKGAGLKADRRSAPTPKGVRISKKTGLRNVRSRRASARYEAAHSLGKIAARPWVRPARQASEVQSVLIFQQVVSKQVEEIVSNYPT